MADPLGMETVQQELENPLRLCELLQWRSHVRGFLLLNTVIFLRPGGS